MRLYLHAFLLIWTTTLSAVCSTVVMVEPYDFGFNAAAAKTNAFQSPNQGIEIHGQALDEFNGLVALLRSSGVEVRVFPDTPLPKTPDSIFPNNWFSVHPDGTLVTYPMQVENRRGERRSDILDWIQNRFHTTRHIDLSSYEQHDLYLEGTGSIIFDHVNHLAYACLSPRTDRSLLSYLCHQLNYTPVIFDAHDELGIPIYHTNVMMALGTHFAVICLDAIADSDQKEQLLALFRQTNRTPILITLDQMRSFCGNIFEVSNSKGERFVVMSDKAYSAFTPSQIATMQKQATILHTPLDTIERIGGGGARCMLAGIHARPLF